MFLAAIIVVAAALTCLHILFPSWGDDWYWAVRSFSWTSVTELNGRYLGSVLSLIITKSVALRVIVCVVLTVLLIYVLSLNGSRHRTFFFIVAAALFFVMPSTLFVQIEAWSSGFANYIPSALVAVTYITLVRREFSDEEPVYSKAAPYIAGALGVVGALFMETVTLGNIVIGAAILIYHFIRFKKPNAVLIAFLGGALLGAVLMFIDPAYFSIASGTDTSGYSRGFRGSFLEVKECYFEQFQYLFLYNNFVLNILITGLFAWLAVKRFPFIGYVRRGAVIACFVMQAVYLFVSALTYFGYDTIVAEESIENKIRGLFTLLFALSVLAETLILIGNVNVKLRCVFLMGSSVAYSLPLLVITPVTSRAFAMAYFIFMIFAITLLGENLSDSGACEKKLTLSFGAVMCALFVAAAAFYTSNYAEIRVAYNERAESIACQIEESGGNPEEITIKSVPVGGKIFDRYIYFVECADPDNENSDFKQYYNIPIDALLLIEG